MGIREFFIRKKKEDPRDNDNQRIDQHHPRVFESFSNLQRRERTQPNSEKAKKRIISQANDWKTLYEAIRSVGWFPSSNGVISAYRIQRMIGQAFNSQNPLERSVFIPKTYGLRDKYRELVIAREKRKYIYPNSSTRIEDPEGYPSKTVEETLDIFERIVHQNGNQNPSRIEQIMAASQAVYKKIPYDYDGYNMVKSSGQINSRFNADQFTNMTAIVTNAQSGVCRHQAPLLLAVLRRLGFDAYQVLHHTFGGDNHTLVYIADPDINAFINPSRADDTRHAIIPFRNYEINLGKKTYNWKTRTDNNEWYLLETSDNKRNRQ